MRFALLLPFLLVGCSLFTDFEPTADDLPLRTDQATYVAQQERGGDKPIYGFNVVIQFENKTGRTVYLDRCYPEDPHPIYIVYLIGQEDDWGAAYNHGWGCVGHDDPISVAAGAIRTDTLHIRGPNAWQTYSNQHFGELEGRFSIGYQAQSCRNEVGCELPYSLTRSNEFEVRLAQ